MLWYLMHQVLQWNLLRQRLLQRRLLLQILLWVLLRVLLRGPWRGQLWRGGGRKRLLLRGE